MKLTSAQIERTLDQYEAKALPDSHPLVARLSEMFGDHTFFLDGNGLNVLEPTVVPAREGADAARVINLANWTDENSRAWRRTSPSRPTRSSSSDRRSTDPRLVSGPRKSKEARCERQAASRSFAPCCWRISAQISLLRPSAEGLRSARHMSSGIC